MCFNPRTHEGCDVLFLVSAVTNSSFNPRTHEGCDEVINKDTVLFSKKKELRKINCRHFVFLYVLSLMGASRPLTPRCFQV